MGAVLVGFLFKHENESQGMNETAGLAYIIKRNFLIFYLTNYWNVIPDAAVFYLPANLTENHQLFHMRRQLTPTLDQAICSFPAKNMGHGKHLF